MSIAPTSRPQLQPRDPHTPDLVNVLHSPKRIRVKFKGQTVADSRAVLVLRSNQFLPIYFFPRGAVRQDLLHPSDHRGRHELGGDVAYESLVVEGAQAVNAAWSFAPSADQSLALLRDHVAFDWHAVDQWFEEDEEVFVHARDPYARIDTLHSTSRIEVRLDGSVLADSIRPVLLFETHLPTRFYLPHADVRLDRLVPSPTQTRCPYKGIASYWSAVRPDGSIVADVAWEYRDPIAEIPKIKGLIAFYPDRVDEIRLDGERVS